VVQRLVSGQQIHHVVPGSPAQAQAAVGEFVLDDQPENPTVEVGGRGDVGDAEPDVGGRGLPQQSGGVGLFQEGAVGSVHDFTSVDWGLGG